MSHVSTDLVRRAIRKVHEPSWVATGNRYEFFIEALQDEADKDSEPDWRTSSGASNCLNARQQHKEREKILRHTEVGEKNSHINGTPISTLPSLPWKKQSQI